MNKDLFTRAVRNAVDQWRLHATIEEAARSLNDPIALGAQMLGLVQEQCEALDVSISEMQQFAQQAPYFHLPHAFDTSDLVDTPVNFMPMPDCEGTIRARATAIAVMTALGQQVVSYGSENDGALFVNLVVIPGEGKNSEKSKSNMRGHTDAVSFPPRGQVDPENEAIAPSPDYVCLVGLRNPDSVETIVMPLTTVLGKLSQEQVDELMKNQFQIHAQQTFVLGTQRILGDVHIVDGASVIYDFDNQLGVRFSHKNVMADGAAPAAEDAIEALKEACASCLEKVVVQPGDILLVSNRFALHGRTEVGEKYGGISRWLLRTYGLAHGAANADQFYKGSNFKLFP